MSTVHDDAQFGRDLDRWLERRANFDNKLIGEFFEQDFAQAWEDYYIPRVVTDFAVCHYKPGEKVKWVDPDGTRREGTVIGATVVDAVPDPTYSVLERYERNKFRYITVDESTLLHGWEPLPDMPPEPAGTLPDPNDIPF